MARLRHDDSGFSLIEVLVSALLVATIAGAALGVISGAGGASASQRSRSQGSSVARAVHESLRTQSPTTIAGYVTTPPADPAPISRNGITYTSHTTAAWVDETTGGAACVGTANITRYVRLTTTTSWTGRSGTATSKVSSLTGIPTGGGRLVVQVFDRNRNPQSGIRVDLTGTSTANATTTASGCVEWDYLTPGPYTITLSRTGGGYVDPDGNTAPSQTATVVDGKLNSVSFDYDQGGYISSRFWYSNDTSGAVSGVVVAGAGDGNDQVTVSNASMPSGKKTYGTAGTAVPTILAGPLFPFPTPYQVIAGTCETPKNTSSSPIYSATVTPGATVNPTAAGSQPDSAGIRLNGFTASIKVNGAAAAGVKVVLVRNADAKCAADKDEPPKTSLAGGTLAFPAVPSGKYDMCGELVVGGVTYSSTEKTGVDLTDYSAPGAFALDVKTDAAHRLPCP